MTEAVGQSLAGRTGVLRLLPFSIAEADTLAPDQTNEPMLYADFYPRIYDQQLEPTQALGDYFETYVERDLRQLCQIRNLEIRVFVKRCAGRVGQLLNTQALGVLVAGCHHISATKTKSAGNA